MVSLALRIFFHTTRRGLNHSESQVSPRESKIKT